MKPARANIAECIQGDRVSLQTRSRKHEGPHERTDKAALRKILDELSLRRGSRPSFEGTGKKSKAPGGLKTDKNDRQQPVDASNEYDAANDKKKKCKPTSYEGYKLLLRFVVGLTEMTCAYAHV